jgi:hypothetical protein
MAILLLPTAFVFVLIFPGSRITSARFCLDVVPPHVLGAFAIGPNVFAGDGTCMAPDALIEMKDH